MKTLFEQMQQHQALAREQGNEIKRWAIRTDLFAEVEVAAREADALSEETQSILGVPYEIADRVGSDNGMLLMEFGPLIF